MGVGSSFSLSLPEKSIASWGTFLPFFLIKDKSPPNPFAGTSTRGFFPLSSTFFRALIPIQSTSWRIASLSVIVTPSLSRDRNAVPGVDPGCRRALAVTRIVDGGTGLEGRREGRIGVTKGCAAGLNDMDGSIVIAMDAAELTIGRDAWGWSTGPSPCAEPDSAGTLLVASSNASLGGPQEKPTKLARPSFNPFVLVLAL